MTRDTGGASGLSLRALFEEGTSTGLSDGQLLERFATGGGAGAEMAFAALVDRHGPMVLRTCRGILRDGHEAMDAYQATFLILARKGGTLRGRDSLAPWLHRVACRAAGRARDVRIRRREVERGRVEAGPGPAEDRGELAAVVHEELDRLPDRYRLPIVLCDLEGRTCEEAARHLGCPIGTVASRLSRGRERLRGRLARRGLAPAVGAIAAAFSNTAAAVPPIAARGLAGTSPAVASLARDVLRGFLMSKLWPAALVAACSIGVVAAWGLSGSGAPPPATPGKAASVPAPQPAGPPKRSVALLRERLAVLKELVALHRDLYRNARVEVQSLSAAEQEWLSAKLELTDRPAERRAIFREFIENTRKMEQVAVAAKEAARGTDIGVLEARALRLKAEADLAREDEGEGRKPAGE